MQSSFLSILDINPEDIPTVLERAAQIKKDREINPILKNKTLIMVFEKASTRTRVSFEVAITELGGNSIFMTPAESQLGRSEPLKDTARVLSRYGHGLIVRTYNQENLQLLAKYSQIPVLNALTDKFHPCQVLSDLLTIFERTPDFSDLKIAWVGDGNNMANSWINLVSYLPIHLSIATPKGFEPNSRVLNQAIDRGARITLSNDPVEAVKRARYINTDVWSSMGQEKQADSRMHEFFPFQINRQLLKNAPAQAQVLHCLPAHRGEEITEEILESSQSIVWDQAENRLHMQKALLEKFMKESGNPGYNV